MKKKTDSKRRRRLSPVDPFLTLLAGVKAQIHHEVVEAVLSRDRALPLVDRWNGLARDLRIRRDKNALDDSTIRVFEEEALNLFKLCHARGEFADFSARIENFPGAPDFSTNVDEHLQWTIVASWALQNGELEENLGKAMEALGDRIARDHGYYLRGR